MKIMTCQIMLKCIKTHESRLQYVNCSSKCNIFAEKMGVALSNAKILTYMPYLMIKVLTIC